MCINRAMAFVKNSEMMRVELLHLQAGVAVSVRLWLLAQLSPTSGMRFCCYVIRFRCMLFMILSSISSVEAGELWEASE